MRRVLPLLTAALILGATVAAVSAQAKVWGGIPPHGHIMLLNAEISEVGILTFDRCVEFAAGRTLTTTAHHESVHTGVAGGSPFVMGKLWDAGKIVAPLAPLTPFTGCESVTSGMQL
jgi:hypothetical protein